MTTKKKKPKKIKKIMWAVSVNGKRLIVVSHTKHQAKQSFYRLLRWCENLKWDKSYKLVKVRVEEV